LLSMSNCGGARKKWNPYLQPGQNKKRFPQRRSALPANLRNTGGNQANGFEKGDAFEQQGIEQRASRLRAIKGRTDVCCPLK
jgi:hypothetical protein